MDLLNLRKFIAPIVALTLVALATQAAVPSQSSEYALKSVFLYNFCRFIEWPNSAFSSSSDPLVIGVFGQDPFGPLLDEAVEGETYHGRPIRIEHYRSPREIKRCQILFVSNSEINRMGEILSVVADKSIVTVGETDTFLDKGGMIALTSERNRVHLRINPGMLRGANITVSSKLLRIAEPKS